MPVTRWTDEQIAKLVAAAIEVVDEVREIRTRSLARLQPTMTAAEMRAVIAEALALD